VPDELRRRVAESRARQGLPPVIEDLAVIERVALAFRLVEPDLSESGPTEQSSALVGRLRAQPPHA
jgi:hypothetical protein